MRKLLALLVLLPLLALLASGQGEAQVGRVYVLHVEGAIGPVVANYINRGISLAEEQGAAAAIIQMDTPGGLDKSMRDIVKRIVNARVPVVVYVGPAGARSASAGVFITLAAHVAAMAPNTAIGAAHPVSIGQSGEVQQLPKEMEEKVLNDAVAYIKSTAQQRSRNVDWAERAVRESVSATEEEALTLNVVDLIAPDLPSLLSQMDGREVTLLGGSKVTLHTQGAATETVGMSFAERFLLTISDPNIAFILLALAMTGIFFELANPGSILPGVVGGISLFLALFALGMLPVNYAGLLLIFLAFILFLAELWVTSHGALAVGGIITLTVGSLVLMSTNSPLFRIDWPVIAAVVGTISAFFAFVAGAVYRSQRLRPTTGREGIVGKVAIARTPLTPEGTVFLEGERWTARLEEGQAEAGEPVVVTALDGLNLRVKKIVRR